MTDMINTMAINFAETLLDAAAEEQFADEEELEEERQREQARLDHLIHDGMSFEEASQWL